MTDFINKLKQNLTELIFTVKCPYCRRVIEKGEYACPDCKEKFPQNSIIDYAVGGYKCVSPFPYDSIFKKAVLSFKFGNRGEFAKQFSFPLVQAVVEVLGSEKFDMITSVPMHKNSVKARGFNQSELLARQCAEVMQIPYVELLEKFKENQKQHSIKSSQRAKNVRGVYRAVDKKLVQDKNVLLIDDIITTGNTLGECARILSKSGCKKISCATLCAVIIK